MEENQSQESFDVSNQSEACQDVHEDDFGELNEMNKVQVQREIIPADQFEKEGFEEGDFEGQGEAQFGGDFIPAATNDLNINTEMMDTADNQILEMKIQNVLQVLANFTALRDPELSRSDYVDELKDLYCRLYGYNTELMDLLMELFGPAECNVFLNSMEEERPVTIRTNTLKVKRKDLAQSLMQRKINLEPVGDWSKVGLKINESKIPVGATQEYLSGHYMLQSACSFLPVLSLAPRPGERVLDMAAAPGGKTSYIAQMMKNKGILIANDVKKERLTGLHFNLQRLGVTNCTVINYDGRKLPNFIGGFDRVLLDAPCTGLGVISRDQSIKTNRFMKDVRKNAHIQKELLRAAVDCCKPGGIIVYSTCSIAVEENEAVLDYITKVRHVKIRETGLPIEKEGIVNFGERKFHPKVKLSRRVYPHVHNMDGFYIAKIQKIKNGAIDGFGVTHNQLSKKELKKKELKQQKRTAEKQEKLKAKKEAEAAEEAKKAEKKLSRKERKKLKANFDKVSKVGQAQEEEAAQAEAEEEAPKEEEAPTPTPTPAPGKSSLIKRKLELLKKKKRLLEMRKKKKKVKSQ